MAISAFTILVGLALILAIVSMIWPHFPTLSVAVVLIAVALLIPKIIVEHLTM